MLFLLEVHAVMEKFHVNNNVKYLIDETILFWGEWGVRVRCRDEEVERTMVFHHIFVSVPRTFSNYCNCYLGFAMTISIHLFLLL